MEVSEAANSPVGALIHGCATLTRIRPIGGSECALVCADEKTLASAYEGVHPGAGGAFQSNNATAQCCDASGPVWVLT